MNSRRPPKKRPAAAAGGEPPLPAAFLALFAASCFLLWPLFRLPFVMDFIDILNKSMPGLNFDMQAFVAPLNFRPLSVPLIRALISAFGLNPLAFRIYLFVLHVLIALLVFRTFRNFSKSASVAFGAACLYVIAPGHWVLFGDVHVQQSSAHLFFWSAFYLWSADRRARTFAAAAALVTVALFLKEDVIVFPVWALLANLCFAANRRPWWQVAAMHGWAVLYIGCRLLVWPSSFLHSTTDRKFSLMAVFEAPKYKTAFMSITSPFRAFFTDYDSVGQFLAWRQIEPFAAAAWAAAAVLFALAIAAAWHKLSLRERDRSLPDGARTVLFGLAACAAAIGPYLFFVRGVNPHDAHRYVLPTAGLSLAAAAAARLAFLRIPRRWRERGGLAAALAAGLYIFLPAALEARFPVPGKTSLHAAVGRYYMTNRLLETITPDFCRENTSVIYAVQHNLRMHHLAMMKCGRRIPFFIAWRAHPIRYATSRTVTLDPYGKYYKLTIAGKTRRPRTYIWPLQPTLR